MATWKARALASFPEFQSDIQRPDYTIYLLFFDLLPAAREAHRTNDEDRLAAIYNFAEWCSRQTALALWDAAGVGFFEHIFDERWMWESAAPWLSGKVRADCRGLWQARLTPAEFADLTRLLEASEPRRIR